MLVARLCLTPWTVAHQAPGKMGIKEQYHQYYTSGTLWDFANHSANTISISTGKCISCSKIILERNLESFKYTPNLDYNTDGTANQ